MKPWVARMLARRMSAKTAVTDSIDKRRRFKKAPGWEVQSCRDIELADPWFGLREWHGVPDTALLRAVEIGWMRGTDVVELGMRERRGRMPNPT